MNLIEATIKVKGSVVSIVLEKMAAPITDQTVNGFSFEQGAFLDLYAKRLYFPPVKFLDGGNSLYAEYVWLNHDDAVDHAKKIYDGLKHMNDQWF